LSSRAKDSGTSRASLEEELHACYDELMSLNDASGGAQIILPACNHHDFLTRYLDDARFVHDPINAKIACKILPGVIDGVDSVKAGLELFGPIPSNIHFLNRNQDYKVLGYQLGAHGDKGVNGARASINGIESSYAKSITAHSHTPQVLRDAHVVGTSTHLRLPYTQGPSSWMNTNAVLYGNGAVQLVNVVNGAWKKNG
jgi:hypothetical protein